MSNLPALLPNATLLVADFSVTCQRDVSFKATLLMLILRKVFDFAKVYGRFL
jgi:hypothetical protein